MSLKFFLFLILLLSTNIMFATRSGLRPKDPNLPELITRWQDSTEHYHLKDNHLEMHPIFFTYDKKYFEDHLLPKKKIVYRTNKNKDFDGAELHKLIDELSKEISEGKTEFKNFEVIKRKDFNYRTLAGNIVVKCTKYPVIVKLFVENPESFVKPYTKGWQTAYFYQMGGGINRFLSGFTRIKNLERIQKKIDDSPNWKEKVALPRKWFWIPEETRWFTVESQNIGNQGHLSILVPSTYAIVADAIDIDLTFSRWNREHRKTALSFCHYVGNCVDPHIDNFVIEKKTKRIVIVDTEHFASMVGLKKPMHFEDYTSWYLQLISKCTADKFFTTRDSRLELQKNPKPVVES